jgi:hypothetical protein
MITIIVLLFEILFTIGLLYNFTPTFILVSLLSAIAIPVAFFAIAVPPPPVLPNSIVAAAA